MRIQFLVAITVIIFGISINCAVKAEQPKSLSADEIVAKANLASYYAGKDGRSDARMKIVDEQGRTQLRQFVILRQDINDGGDQNFLVFFSRPSDVRGTVFLVNKHPGDDDDRWLYLPGLDLVKRISAGDKRTSFVGSHYYYEDVSGRSPEADAHQLLGETDQYYLLKHTPKKREEVEFNYYKTKIDKQTFIPMVIEYFDKNGQPNRTVEVNSTEVVEGFPTVTESKITDHKLNGYTIMQFKFMDYNLGVPVEVFSERSLRNPPEEWLKRSN